jgi:LacI family transcriptional regulator
MVNAKKIAELANVSRSTVQRALSGNGKVAEKTRERVLQIAEKLGYSINKPARALVMRQQNLEYSVVFSIPENQFYREVLRGIEKAKEEIRDFGVNVDVHFMEKIEEHQQAEFLKSLVEQGKRGIVFVPYDSKEVRNVVNMGTKMGTVFVAVVSDIPGTKRLCFVGQDLYRSGLVAGNLMTKLLGPEEKVACFVGSNSFSAHRDRLNGFMDRYTGIYSRENIVNVVENYDSSTMSVKLTESLLDAQPELRALYIVGAGVSGVCEVVEKRGLQDSIKIISYDLVQSKEYCKRGIIDLVIDQDPVEEGYKALTVLNNYIMFDEQPADKIFTGVDIRTGDNLD